MELRTVGVIGAGVMGSGVAQNLAQKGIQVVLIDVSKAILDQTEKNIYNNLRFQGFINKEEKVERPEEIVERITFTTDYQSLEGVDFVVENVIENWEIKRGVYSIIDEICAANCRFAANTSAISITRIGSLTKRPDKVLGMHFMNPVPMKKMVEVIRGYHTTEETLEAAKYLLSIMDKDYIVVNDSPGFVTNRILMLTVNEAVFTVQDQVATAQDVDNIFKSCFDHKMGPLETADLIGLDTILYSLEVLYKSFNDSKYRPCPLLKKMVDAGLYGRKNGQGFYAYQITS